MDQKNLIHFEQHFHKNGHDFNKDKIFTNIERKGKDRN